MARRVVLALILAAVGAAAGASSTHQSLTIVPPDPSGVGYLSLTKRHPDGLDGPQDFQQSFTTVEALQRLEQLRGALRSFRVLTQSVRNQQGPSMLQSVGNTESDMQTVGFHNIPLAVEGTLLKQAYETAQARYELSRARYEQGRSTDQSVAEARRAYEQATRRFQAWDTKRPGD